MMNVKGKQAQALLACGGMRQLQQRGRIQPAAVGDSDGSRGRSRSRRQNGNARQDIS